MKEIIIDSQFRTNGTNESFNVVIPYCTEIKLLEAYIPISFFNITAGSFIINGTNSGVSTIGVLAGKYTQNTLTAYVQNQLNILKPLETYTVGVDLANRFSIVSSETFTADFTLFAGMGFTGIYPLSNTITGSSTTAIFHVPYATIKSANILGVDNGTLITGSTGVLHVVPLCSSGAAIYRASEESTWAKIIMPIQYSAAININFSIYTNGQDLNGARWFIKILTKY